MSTEMSTTIDIPYRDAVAAVMAEASKRTTPAETVPLVLAAGRVLAETIIAQENIPSAANSAMDGYAIQAVTSAGGSVEHPVRLRVIGESSAGRPFEGVIAEGDAVRIMTGGLVPEGADGVIEVESTFEADGYVDLRREISSGTAIRRAGEDISLGSAVLSAGRAITPGDIGVLASLGVTNVPVRTRPIIGILSTGNEVIEPHRTPLAGEIRNSGGPALYAACVRAGAEPIDLGIAPDDLDELSERIEEGLRYDILLTTGGVSAGKYDHVQRIFPKLSVEIRFHKVWIRPGRPVLFGVLEESAGGTLVFGLPGNPVSSLLTFSRFVLPAIRALTAQRQEERLLQGCLSEPIRKHDSKYHFLRGYVESNPNGELTVRTTGTQSSGAMTSMSRANCLIHLDETTRDLEAGETVRLELLDL
jgi:molybdopterin molybdotransferase